MLDRFKYDDLPNVDQKCKTPCALPPAPNIQVIKTAGQLANTNSTMLDRFKYDDLPNVDQKCKTPCALSPALNIRNIKLAGQLAKTNSTIFDRFKYDDLPKLDQSCITYCALPPAPNIKIIESVDLTTKTNSTMLGRFKYDDLLNVDQKYKTPYALPPAFHIQNINTADLIAKTNSTILDKSKYDEPFNVEYKFSFKSITDYMNTTIKNLQNSNISITSVSVSLVVNVYYYVAFEKRLSNFAYDEPASATSLSATPPTRTQINLQFIGYFFNMHIYIVSIYDWLTTHSFDFGALPATYFFELLYDYHIFFEFLYSMLPFLLKYSLLLVVKWYYFRISQNKNITTSLIHSLISIDNTSKLLCFLYFFCSKYLRNILRKADSTFSSTLVFQILTISHQFETYHSKSNHLNSNIKVSITFSPSYVSDYITIFSLRVHSVICNHQILIIYQSSARNLQNSFLIASCILKDNRAKFVVLFNMVCLSLVSMGTFLSKWYYTRILQNMNIKTLFIQLNLFPSSALVVLVVIFYYCISFEKELGVGNFTYDNPVSATDLFHDFSILTQVILQFIEYFINVYIDMVSSYDWHTIHTFDFGALPAKKNFFELSYDFHIFFEVIVSQIFINLINDLEKSNSSFSSNTKYFLYCPVIIFVFKIEIKKLLYSMLPFFLKYSPLLVVKCYFIKISNNMKFKTPFIQSLIHCILCLIASYFSFSKVHHNKKFHLIAYMEHSNHASYFTFNKVYLNLILSFFVSVKEQFKIFSILLFNWIFHKFKNSITKCFYFKYNLVFKSFFCLAEFSIFNSKLITLFSFQ